MNPVFVSELFGIFKRRLKDAGIHLMYDAYHCLHTIAMTATFDDPHDSQKYRMAIVPADCDILVRTPNGSVVDMSAER
ncbi:MAG: hypothetical protein OXT06_09180 [Rhodospirillaceae bacterium]|nr:hypothetical protein [Rhodospirillaceae bacterium]